MLWLCSMTIRHDKCLTIFCNSTITTAMTAYRLLKPGSRAFAVPCWCYLPGAFSPLCLLSTPPHHTQIRWMSSVGT